MPSRPRIQWRALDGTDEDVMWTPGWLPDSSTLRWSLANDLRVEGVRDGWTASYETADGARIEEGYVGEDDFGDVVRVDPGGYTTDGSRVSDFKAATFAYLGDPAQI